MAAESEALVGDLDPWQVYELRAVPHNGRGVGPPSESTGPLMVGREGDALAAPQVRAVGSASFSLSWTDVTGPCRPQSTTRVSYRNAGGSHNGSSWQTFTAAASGSTLLAYPVRCPNGCAFRVETGSGDGRWAAPSAASAVAHNRPLPELSWGDVRLELRLRSEQPDRDTLQMSLDAAADMASALRLEDDSAVTVHEVYGAGRYIVADVRSAVQDGQRQACTASLLAQQLALMAREPMDESWGLRAGAATQEVESVAMLVAGGGAVWTAVHPSEEARERLGRLSRWYGDGRAGGGGGGLLDQARHFVMVVSALVLVVWCCSQSGAKRGGYRVVDGRE